MTNYSIEKAQDSANTFYRVLLNDVVVAQREHLEEAQEYVSSKINGEISLNFTKTTTNAATKGKVELCTSVENELHIIADFENNDCASVAYELVGGVLFLVKQWDNTKKFPSIITTEKELRQVIKEV